MMTKSKFEMIDEDVIGRVEFSSDTLVKATWDHSSKIKQLKIVVNRDLVFTSHATTALFKMKNRYSNELGLFSPERQTLEAINETLTNLIKDMMRQKLLKFEGTYWARFIDSAMSESDFPPINSTGFVKFIYDRFNYSDPKDCYFYPFNDDYLPCDRKEFGGYLVNLDYLEVDWNF